MKRGTRSIRPEDKIERDGLQIGAEQALRDELNALDASFLNNIEGYQTCLDRRRDAMLRCLETPQLG